MVPQFEGKAPENDERIGDLSEREFVVMGELAKHLVPEPTEISYELKEDEGESYLLLGEGKGHGEFSTPIGDYHISKNSEDEASTIQMQLSGKNWNFVIRDFLNGINPVLD
ncbi:MAG: hypothetical protein HQ519_06695, partial [Planctomycetes bacterium]|nr:hypothetical protein [Planctomycetota bacterium]